MPTRETASKDRLVIIDDSGEKLQFDYKVVITNDGPLETLWLKHNKMKENGKYDVAEPCWKLKKHEVRRDLWS